jgi:MFS family permease
MREQRWLRIIPVALVMYTISYIDRTNISLALDPTISSMMRDLFMDDRMKGEAAGIFFFGYVLLQIPGGYWATRWSARKIISLFLISWGICAIGCGLARTFRQLEVMRFLLGVAESGVFPATLVLLIGLVNAFGNLGGFAGPYIAGWLKQEYQSLTVAFDALGAGLLAGAALAFLLPKQALSPASPPPTR